MTRSTSLLINRLPPIGIVLFVILYIYASTLYPGGSQENIVNSGFDWTHNYLCNLMNENAINGQVNPAKRFSIFAIIILCSSLLIFLVQFAFTFPMSELWRKAILINGSISMIFASLLFTDFHDLVTLLSSVFGAVAVFGIIKSIYLSDLSSFKISGLLCIVLLGVNNIIYYSQYYLYYLPFIQKITLGIILLWVLTLNFEIRNILKKKEVVKSSNHKI